MPEAERSPFATLLRRLRLRAGLSQDELAEAARMSTDGVGALERGTRRAPYRETVEMLATAVGASAEEREELLSAAQRKRRLPGSGLQPAEPATEQPPRAETHGLPAELTPLRGRERALQDTRALIGHRLVTICGPGGIGKTRLAVALCERLASAASFERIWYVSLEALGSSELVAGNVARVVGAGRASDADGDEYITAALGERSGLLVLDNCEHVNSGVARLVEGVLSGCPSIHVLTTSRRPLGIGGEAVYRLDSLELPLAGNISARDALRYGALILFADRARSADQSFTLDDAQTPLVVEICRRLDGIPLAIELAAARLRVLSLASLAKHLDERFRLLTAGSAQAMPRHRTLGALIDWSYDLLSPAERAVLDRASVFAGSFDLEAAGAVCADDGSDVYDVLDLISSLGDQSLIIAETTRDRERYRLLESTREYATQRLDAGGAAEETLRRHAQHFASVARAADATWGAIKAGPWVSAYEPDLDNFRRALQWTIERGNDVLVGGSIAGSLERLWINAGLEVEGRRWICEALARIDNGAHPLVAIRLWRALAWMQIGNGKYEAAAHVVELAEHVNDDFSLADGLRQLALGASQMGRQEEAGAANERALRIFRALGDRRCIANCLDLAGRLAHHSGRPAEARRALEEAMSIFRELGSDGGVASVLVGLAECVSLDDDLDRAIELMREARTIHERGKSTANLAMDAMMLTVYLTRRGDYTDAEESLAAALDWGKTSGNGPCVATSLWYGAVLAARCGEVERAARLMGYATRARAHFDLGMDASEGAFLRSYDDAVRSRLSERMQAELGAEGAAWSEDEALRQAVPVRAAVAHAS